MPWILLLCNGAKYAYNCTTPWETLQLSNTEMGKNSSVQVCKIPPVTYNAETLKGVCVLPVFGCD